MAAGRAIQCAVFGDAGQGFDPFVYLGLLAGATARIGLGVANDLPPHFHQ